MPVIKPLQTKKVTDPSLIFELDSAKAEADATKVNLLKTEEPPAENFYEKTTGSVNALKKSWQDAIDLKLGKGYPEGRHPHAGKLKEWTTVINAVMLPVQIFAHWLDTEATPEEQAFVAAMPSGEFNNLISNSIRGTIPAKAVASLMEFLSAVPAEAAGGIADYPLGKMQEAGMISSQTRKTGDELAQAAGPFIAGAAGKLFGSRVAGGVARKVFPGLDEHLYNAALRMPFEEFGERAATIEKGLKERHQVGGSFQSGAERATQMESLKEGIFQNEIRPRVQNLENIGVRLTADEAVNRAIPEMEKLLKMQSPSEFATGKFRKMITNVNGDGIADMFREKYRQQGGLITPTEMQNMKSAVHQGVSYDVEGTVAQAFDKAMAKVFRQVLEEADPALKDINMDYFAIRTIGEAVKEEALKSGAKLPTGISGTPFYMGITEPIRGAAIAGGRHLLSSSAALSKAAFLIRSLKELGLEEHVAGRPGFPTQPPAGAAQGPVGTMPPGGGGTPTVPPSRGLPTPPAAGGPVGSATVVPPTALPGGGGPIVRSAGRAATQAEGAARNLLGPADIGKLPEGGTEITAPQTEGVVSPEMMQTWIERGKKSKQRAYDAGLEYGSTEEAYSFGANLDVAQAKALWDEYKANQEGLHPKINQLKKEALDGYVTKQLKMNPKSLDELQIDEFLSEQPSGGTQAPRPTEGASAPLLLPEAKALPPSVVDLAQLARPVETAANPKALLPQRTWTSQQKPAPPFHLRSDEVVMSVPNTVKAQSLKNYLSKAGISQLEMKWTRIDDLLKTKKPNEVVSREELATWIKNNRVEISPKILGQPIVSEKMLNAKSELAKIGIISEISPDGEMIGFKYLNDPDYQIFSASELEPHQQKYAKIVEDEFIPGQQELTKYEEHNPFNTGTNPQEHLLQTDISANSRYNLVAKEKFGKSHAKDLTDTELTSVVDEVEKRYRNEISQELYEKNYDELDGATKNSVDIEIEARGSQQNFTGGHFGDVAPNIAAHIRTWDLSNDVSVVPQGNSGFYDIKDSKGNILETYSAQNKTIALDEFNSEHKVLGVGEIQADWNLAGRKGGFDLGTVPDFPFKGTAWVDLSLKYILRHAAEKGYDKIVFASPEQVKGLYNLENQVDAVLVDRTGTGNYVVKIKPKGKTEYENIDQSIVDKNKLQDVIGKDLANKVNENPNSRSEFKGIDLKIGGKWADKLYGKTIPDMLNKLGKEYGVKAEQENIKLKNSERMREIAETGETKGSKNQTSFTLTPKMKQDILRRGFELGFGLYIMHQLQGQQQEEQH